MARVISVRKLPQEEQLYDIGVEQNNNFYADFILVHNCHRFSKTQQDVLLPYVEDGHLIFIGASVENPFHSIIPPLVSRCHIFEFNRLSLKEMAVLAVRAIRHYRSLGKEVLVNKDAIRHLINMSCGDGRKILNLIELAVDTGPIGEVTLEVARDVAPSKYIHFGVDDHFDLASAFQGSIQASDPDAAVFWLAKWLESGEDPRYIARRLLVSAAEDACSTPMCTVIAHAAYRAACDIGRPECDIVLSQATIMIAQAERNKSAANAIWAALRDVRNREDVEVPKEMKDCHYPGARELGRGQFKDGSDLGSYVGVSKTYVT